MSLQSPLPGLDPGLAPAMFPKRVCNCKLGNTLLAAVVRCCRYSRTLVDPNTMTIQNVMGSEPDCTAEEVLGKTSC